MPGITLTGPLRGLDWGVDSMAERDPNAAVAETPEAKIASAYLATLQDWTPHFAVYYDAEVRSGAGGGDGSVSSNEMQRIAKAVAATCETDYETISYYFGGITPRGLPFRIRIGDFGLQEAFHFGCAGMDLFCGVRPCSPNGYASAAIATPALEDDFTRLLVVAEMVEVFAAAQNRGWGCGQSHGEGLSRALASYLYPRVKVGSAGGVWLEIKEPPDFVTETQNSDTDPVSTGCAVLFLNYLRHQLGYEWREIVQAGGLTLAVTYLNLTGRPDSFEPFKELLCSNREACFARFSTLPDTDNPFPLEWPVSSPLRHRYPVKPAALSASASAPQSRP